MASGKQPVRRSVWWCLGLAGLGLAGVWVWSGRRAAPERVPAATVAPPASVSAIELAQLEQAARTQPRDARVAVELGRVYGRLGRYSDALAVFQRGIRLDPGLLSARVGAGQMWSKLERPGKAVEAYQHAAKRMPHEPLIHLELARGYLDLRDFGAALSAVREAERLDPRNPEIQRALGTIHGATGNVSATLAAGRKALELAPEDVENWTHMGALCYGTRRYGEAVKYLRQALQRDPGDVYANVVLAESLFELEQEDGSWQEMHGLLVRALSLSPYEPRALYLLGRLYMKRHDFRRAASTLRRARSVDPESESVLLALGQALLRQGRAAEGRSLIARAKKGLDRTVDFRGLEFQASRNPNPNLLLRLARLYEHNGQRDSAIHVLRSGLRKRPDSSSLKRALEDLERASAAQSGAERGGG